MQFALLVHESPAALASRQNEGDDPYLAAWRISSAAGDSCTSKANCIIGLLEKDWIEVQHTREFHMSFTCSSWLCSTLNLSSK